jgi:HK97 gp10 family phage protein
MPIFSLKIEGLTELTKSFNKSPQIVVPALQNAIKTSINIIRPVMVKHSPYKTGKLRQNIYARTTGLTGEVGPNLQVTKYAYFVHEGTRPYDIRPRYKQALYWKGSLYPVKVVHHPGIKGNPFVEKTLEEVEPYINQIFSNARQSIITKLINK